MKLRSSIRPPQRLNSEEFESPYAQKTLRRPKKAIERPTIIEFDPNQPPAAFPTLDKPRVPGSSDDNVGNSQDDSDSSVDLEDITFEEIENLKASNGPWNPIYVRNMNLMANAGRHSSNMDLDPMRDSDGDIMMDGFDQELLAVSDSTMTSPASSHKLQAKMDSSLTISQSASTVIDPQWNDLPASLRVEIFSNLLESHSWTHACLKLELGDTEQEALQMAWTERDKQMEYEDAQLEKMRGQQLRDLMRIDNSIPNPNPKSVYLRFRKVRRRFMHGLRRMPGLGLFMCSSKDISMAKILLNKRGLSLRLVGEWSNTVPVVEGSEESSDSDDLGCPNSRTLRWNLEPIGIETSDLQPGLTPTRGHSKTRRKPTVTTASKISLINGIGPATLTGPRDVPQHQNVVINPVPRWINAPAQTISQPSRPTGLVSLNIGMQRAAQIRSITQPASIDPAKLVRRAPSPGHVSEILIPTVEEAVDTRDVPFRPTRAPITRPSSTSSEEPVRRVLGGNWSYLSAGPTQNLANTSARRARKSQGEASPHSRTENRRTGHGSTEQRSSMPQPELSSSFIPRPTDIEHWKSPSPLSLDDVQVPTSHRRLPLSHDGVISRSVSPALNEDPGRTDTALPLPSQILETSPAASPAMNEDPRQETDSMTNTPPTSDNRPTAQTSESEAEGATDNDRGEDLEIEAEMDEMVLLPCGPSG